MSLLLLISVLSFLSIFKHKMYHGGGAQEVADCRSPWWGEVGSAYPTGRSTCHRPGGVRSAPLTPPGAARVTAGGCLAALAHVTALGAGRL